MKYTQPPLRKESAVRMNYRATAQYFELRARRQRRHPSVRAHYAAEAERYRQLAQQEEESLCSGTIGAEEIE